MTDSTHDEPRSSPAADCILCTGESFSGWSDNEPIMPTYISLVDVDDKTFQNIQELSVLWGDIRDQVEQFDVTIEHSYAVLGAYDFIVIMDAPDRDTMFQASLKMQGYGLDLQTMEIAPTDYFADLVDDV